MRNYPWKGHVQGHSVASSVAYLFTHFYSPAFLLLIYLWNASVCWQELIKRYEIKHEAQRSQMDHATRYVCLLYTSDAADE